MMCFHSRPMLMTPSLGPTYIGIPFSVVENVQSIAQGLSGTEGKHALFVNKN